MKITITRALRELKSLDARITETTSKLVAVDVRQNKYKGKALNSNMLQDEFEKKAKSEYESINELINNRKKIKAALMKANAMTMVTIAGEQLSIVEVIELKNTLPYLQTLRTKLVAQSSSVKNEMERARVSLDKQVETLVSNNTGKDRKADKEDFDRIAVPFIEANAAHMIDPLGVEAEIKKLDDKIRVINDEVDIVLSEVNAKTEIEI